MGQTALKDNLEDMLMGGSFYSSASTESQLTRLRESVQIRNSLSSQSISKATGSIEKTSFMKNSPSIKALESILNQKSQSGGGSGPAATNGGGSGDVDVGESIQEEDEDLEDTDETLFSGASSRPSSATRMQSNNPFRQSTHMGSAGGAGRLEMLHRDETYSVQTFETAHTHKSAGSRADSVSTIDGSGDTKSETTPVISPGPEFLHDKGAFIADASNNDIFSQKPMGSNLTGHRRVSNEQDDTLIDEKEEQNTHDKKVGAATESAAPKMDSTPRQKTKSMIPDDIEFEQPAIRTATRSKDSLASGSPRKNSNAMGTPKQSNFPSFETPQLYKSPMSLASSKASPRKSPHLRSNSAFSLSFGKNKESNPSPGKHKRSSTLTDLSRISDSVQDTGDKKKFSFKSLFKSKSRSNLAKSSVDNEVPNPGKVKEKSYSTTNLHDDSVRNQEKVARPSAQTHNDDNLNGSNIKKTNNKKKRENTTHTGSFGMSPSTSLLNVFRKNKNASPAVSLADEKAYIKDDLGIYGAGNLGNEDLNGSKAFKSNTNINFIREVTDDNYSSRGDNYGYVQSDLNDKELNFNEDDYDSKNLLNNPPIKLSNARYDEEMSLVPDKPDSMPLGKGDLFGSPFQVDYKSSITTPRITSSEYQPDIPSSSKVLRDVCEPNEEDQKEGFKSQRSSKSKEQLAGETFFPRSLSPHEVESIVSLDRSRSMRSVRSNKRSSFVNYDGSDENIIHYQGEGSNPLSSGSVSRSGSILKNSSSKKSLRIDDYTNNTNGGGGDDTEDPNYSALFEFTDFIDLDNLDFSTSPVSSKGISPEPSRSPSHSVITVPDESGTFDSSVILETPPPSKSVDVKSPEKELQPSIPIPLTPNLEIINSAKLASPESLTSRESEVSSRLRDSYQSANSPQLNEYGKSVTNNRPISMSFTGLKGPAFGSHLANKDLRTSDSHQSFNISFADDETDYSGTEVGGGFGSSDGEDSLLDSPGKENGYQHREYSTSSSKRSYGSNGYNNNTFSPPKPFMHNKIPSLSDSNNSSPMSISSVVSKLRRSPQGRHGQKVRRVPKVNVRFSSRIILYDTYNGDEYDRHPDTATCNQITPLMAQQIREEMNIVKSQMEVHEDSRCYTHFF